jgi:hypothetical protein
MFDGPEYIISSIILQGHCITTALPGEVCALDSYAVECDQFGLIADTCRCYDSVDNTSNSICEGILG